MNILCRFGIHKWGELVKKPLQLSGISTVVLTWKDREGYRSCMRCKKKQWYKRSNFTGDGVGESK